ncbi:MAG: AbrB/MazE/SpoVT family DNA-binding domain-containing protein [Deltaproteobacteria bacterium]|nr:AbrB/MazE/SpoVT family DNA-binding domain-containing protein [Deltaproteobacteria bacterium]
MLAKRTSKNQLTLPKKVAGIFEGIDYFDISVKDNVIILKPVKITPAGSTMESVRDKVETLGLKDEDIKKAIRWARRKKSA